MPGWSEQEPEDWWAATCACLDALAAEHRRRCAPCARSAWPARCTARRCSMPTARCCAPASSGTTAAARRSARSSRPRCRRCARSPATSRCPASPRRSCCGCASTSRTCSRASRRVLLPKAWLRWRLCGEAIEDMSDASGTLWLDVARTALVRPNCWRPAGSTNRTCRAWSKARCRPANCAPQWVERWGFEHAPIIAGGAGDNAAGAVALGAVNAGDAFLSLGTSGVLWVTTAQHAPGARARRARLLPRGAADLAPDGRAAERRGVARVVGRVHRQRRSHAARRAAGAGRTRRRAVLVPALPERRAHAAQRRRGARRVPATGRVHDPAADDAGGARGRRACLPRRARCARQRRHALGRAPT